MDLQVQMDSQVPMEEELEIPLLYIPHPLIICLFLCRDGMDQKEMLEKWDQEETGYLK